MATLSFPLSCWFGLESDGVEVTGNAYARQPAVLAVTEDGVSEANAGSVQWPVASGSWGTIDTVQIWDSSAGGTLLGALPTITLVPIAMYERARIPAGGLSVAAPVGSAVGFGTGRFGAGLYAPQYSLSGVGTGIGSPYGLWGYGTGPYETMVQGALLQKTFAPVLPCGGTPGTWAPALTGCCT